MAATKALICFVRRRCLHPFTIPMTTTKINLYLPSSKPQVYYSTEKSVTKSGQNESGNQVQVGFAEVVKENTKSAWYMAIIIAGATVTGIMFYAIFRELFSSKSPNSVYSQAAERCEYHPRVIDALGLPIKCYGEETRRGRRGHVSHTVYEKDGVQRMRMKFYIKGARKNGTVHLEMREDANGNWMYRYLFIQLKDMNRTVIILEDNRDSENIVYNNAEETHELMPPGYKEKLF